MVQHDSLTWCCSRRAFLGAAAAGFAALAAPQAAAQVQRDSYETHAQGIRILPGHWRPHYPWEHIVWISPSWPSQDYLWLDFPEAIFSSQGLLFLSHVNPPFPTVFEELPAAPWVREPDGVSFERVLPNGIAFGGSARKGTETTVDLTLFIRNGSAEPLRDITLQTCAFLRGIKEFADYTQTNKFVQIPGRGWVPLSEAQHLPDDPARRYRVGWRRSGRRVTDLPVVVTVSNESERLFAYTWGEHTLSIVSNGRHPCAHADPLFPDLEPGEAAEIHGQLIFFEGPLEAFSLSKT